MGVLSVHGALCPCSLQPCQGASEPPTKGAPPRWRLYHMYLTPSMAASVRQKDDPTPPLVPGATHVLRTRRRRFR